MHCYVSIYTTKQQAMIIAEHTQIPSIKIFRQQSQGSKFMPNNLGCSRLVYYGHKRLKTWGRGLKEISNMSAIEAAILGIPIPSLSTK